MRNFFYISIVLCLGIFGSRYVEAAVLSPNQQDWLSKQNNTLIVRPEKSYPPFSFISSGSIKPKGLAVDYLELVARKISAQPTYLEAKSLSTIMKDIQSGKQGIVLALTQTDERENQFYFSEPFVSLPVVIVTRKDFKIGNKELTLGDFSAKQVAITDGYGAMEYVKNNYQKIIIDSVSDDEVALQKVLLGEVDAAIMDVASLSYYTSRDMLSYVTIAGQTGYTYDLSFAVPKNMPELQEILNAGLKEITPSEKSLIADRWITFPENQQNSRGFLSPLFVGTPLWIGMSVVGGIIIVILLISIIVHTRRHHSLHTAALSRQRKKEQDLQALNGHLEELEEASAVLGENMQEIKSLEKAIQEKIHHIND